MPDSTVTITDGSLDFSGGINSVVVTTIQSDRNPNGLPRNCLAWLNNGTVRDGGITPRGGWQPVSIIHPGGVLFQGQFMYQPLGANPYLVISLGGEIYKMDVETGGVVNLSAQFGLTNSATEPYAYFVQAEQFLVIQSGDLVTLPLIWDGTTLRRSNGITGNTGYTPGVGSAVYALLPNTPWVVPPVGSSVTIGLTSNYPGVVGDIGVYTNDISTVSLATFEVTAAPAGFVTFKTVSSDWVGASVASGYSATFAVGNVVIPSGGINEIPAAGPMDYFMGRLWYAQGRLVAAGDIVRGPSGTSAYDFTDSVLKITENPMVIGGDGFTVPSEAGNVRAIKHSANIDASLGQGRLFVSTIKAIYALNVPVTRTDWIAATNSNQPLMTVVQLSNGWVNDRSVVAVNGDLFGQSLEPGIRSLNQTMRFFGQWGNIPISANEQRILQYNDRSLLRFGSGMYFDNRLYESALPKQTDFGVVHQALIPLDFVPISSFNSQKPPNWEGMGEGLDFFQLNTGDFGGRERAFAAVLSREDQTFQLWELTTFLKTDLNYSSTEENRITMIAETPAFTWGDEMELKKLIGAEFWIDRLSGTVQFTLEYRPDGQACWNLWHIWKKCSPKNSAEDASNPISYPLTPCAESYFSTMTVPSPDPTKCASATGRPANIGYQFQARLTVHGFCRVRGIYLHANVVERKLYQNLTC